MYKLLIPLLLIPFTYAQAELTLEVQKEIYTDGEHLLVYGNSLKEESLLLRLVSPDGTIVKFDQIQATLEGEYLHVLVSWPTSSIQFPYGTYLVEVISTTRPGIDNSTNVRFSSEEMSSISVVKQISTTVFAPETASVESNIRVFVQTTSDGQLLGHRPNTLLKTSHVHLPDNSLVPLIDSITLLHEGLFYLDYTPSTTGTFVFHFVTFDKGTVSHGSAATTVLNQDITDISNQVNKLNVILDDTSVELATLQTEIQGFSTIQDHVQRTMESTVNSMTTSVSNIESASLQINSLLFPISALIAIIIALQIVILARRR